MDKHRLEAFSDGVIAIIITIMVLELKVPHGSSLADLRPLEGGLDAQREDRLAPASSGESDMARGRGVSKNLETSGVVPHRAFHVDAIASRTDAACFIATAAFVASPRNPSERSCYGALVHAMQ